jgi:hypothetical protein
MLKHIYRENGERKEIIFPYKSSQKGIDYKQLGPYYEWRKDNKNRHTEWLGLFITKD